MSDSQSLRSSKVDETAFLKTSTSGSSSQAEEDPHAYRKPDTKFDSRCPCPALNTLANHGYLPRDGKNIAVQQLFDALQRPDTYNLSSDLVNVLFRGGEAVAEASVQSTTCLLHNNPDGFTLHELGRHGIFEHHSSHTHKNTPDGNSFGPSHTDAALLDDFLGDRTTIELTDIADRRVALERVSPLDIIHAEIARGEWALVLGVFGHAYGGKVPVDILRAWLSENRFLDKWQPTHEQGLQETHDTIGMIHMAMQNNREHQNQNEGWTAEDERLKRMLTCDPEEVEALT